MDKKIIEYIRVYYKLPAEVSDEQIEKELNGSFGEAFANIYRAKLDLKKAIGGAQPDIFKEQL